LLRYAALILLILLIALQVKLWTGQGAVAMSMTPEEFDKYLRGDIVKWADVVKQFAQKPQ
jgi:hypothetical protein